MSFLRDLTKPDCPTPKEHIWYLVWDGKQDLIRWDCHQCRAAETLREFKEHLGVLGDALGLPQEEVTH
jgi:hypothetical protein